MKCPSCGAQMGLEDEVCPYCGTPNTQALQHQSDMTHYRQEYARTQADVIEKTSFMQSQGSWLVVLVVLLFALVIGIVLNVNAWDIGYYIREGNVERNFAQDSQVLDAYLEQGDYGQFTGYYHAKDISLADDDSYGALNVVASSYVDLLDYVSGLGNANDYRFSPERVSETCEYIASDLNTIFTIERDYSYDIERYLPESKRPYLDDIRERATVISMAYLGLSKEQVADIPNISERRLAQLVEEGIAS